MKRAARVGAAILGAWAFAVTYTWYSLVNILRKAD